MTTMVSLRPMPCTGIMGRSDLIGHVRTWAGGEDLEAW